MNIWQELHRCAAVRGLDVIETTLLGEVPWSLGADGKSVSHIPAWLADEARRNGFEILAADWRSDRYTLRLMRGK